jgi:hypothetical protein
MSTIFGGAAPPNAGNFNGNTGNDFTVNHTGNCTGGWWYRPAASTSAQATIGLWKTLPEGAPTLLTSKNGGGMTAGAWNFVAWDAAVALTPGEVYTVAAYDHDGQIAWTPSALDNRYIYNSPFSAIRARVSAGAALAFPTTIFGDAYGVDVEFVATEPCDPCPPCPPTEGFLINLTSPGFINVVTGVGSCVIGALEQTPAGAPCRQCTLYPSSQIPWDNCGPCTEACEGQVALAITGVYGSDQFPRPLNGASWRKCSHRYEIVRFIVQVTRCLPGADDEGNAPGCDLELAAAVRLENDRTATRQAIACCLASANQSTPALVSEWVIGETTTLPESGNCGGILTEVLVGVQSCLCPD